MPDRPQPRPRPTPPGPSPRRSRPAPRTPALERLEFLERKEATRRSIQRNASQARGELERGNPEEVIRITGLMLRGKNLRTLVSPQIPLVYYRGRAFEALALSIIVVFVLISVRKFEQVFKHLRGGSYELDLMDSESESASDD